MPLEPYGSIVLAQQTIQKSSKPITKFALVTDALIVRGREDTNL